MGLWWLGQGKALNAVQWSDTDDAMILLATHRYGWGSFDRARADPSLNLTQKVPPDSSKDVVAGASVLPKKEMVMKRVTQLIKAVKGQEKMEKRKRKQMQRSRGPSPIGPPGAAQPRPQAPNRKVVAIPSVSTLSLWETLRVSPAQAAWCAFLDAGRRARLQSGLARPPARTPRRRPPPPPCRAR